MNVARLPLPEPTAVLRLKDVIATGQVLRVCCGTCGHTDEVAPTSIDAPVDLPIAEVRRMLSCTPCGSRWIDVRQSAPGRVPRAQNIG